MQFEWDRRKAEANRRKHRVAFGEAVSVFYDPLSATFPDPDALRDERFITIGKSSSQRLLAVVHAERGETIRIISARLATAHERKRHERS
jgi:uncharacterized DUF497 family protein